MEKRGPLQPDFHEEIYRPSLDHKYPYDYEHDHLHEAITERIMHDALGA